MPKAWGNAVSACLISLSALFVAFWAGNIYASAEAGAEMGGLTLLFLSGVIAALAFLFTMLVGTVLSEGDLLGKSDLRNGEVYWTVQAWEKSGTEWIVLLRARDGSTRYFMLPSQPPQIFQVKGEGASRTFEDLGTVGTVTT